MGQAEPTTEVGVLSIDCGVCSSPRLRTESAPLCDISQHVAFYFAFLESYFWFLVIAACFGVASYFLLPQYSLIIAVANCLWSVVFVEQWKRQEVDLAVCWNVRSVSQFHSKRAQFQPETETKDPVTGEMVKVFPAWKRLTKQVPYGCIYQMIDCKQTTT
ncbi:calcium-activated chloride channel-domain-containing protein [Sphaerosporella brunnea]|uniref:Calcium-activated chloride channel-domain-containing protein n=1 Tax=Sphaerosporella brunnea TaxID=1250544 RepID=A0A5J5ED25_9PEZI|nr:calcium-activated chloride channel-domain-containing protein [Sphaerosporella brunnea]